MGIPTYIFIIKDRQDDGGKDEDSCLQTRNSCFKNEERHGEDEKSSYHRRISRRGIHELEKGTDSQRDLFPPISQHIECSESMKEGDEVLQAISETRSGRWGFEGSDSRRSLLPPRHDERFSEGDFKCVCQSPSQPTRKLFL